MNAHDKYAALLDAFIDGELPAQEAGEVREHLTLCADCRAYVSDALAMRDAFPDIAETVVPDGFAESVLAALPPRQVPWRTQWKKFVLPLAACLTVFLLVRGLSPENRVGGGAAADNTEGTISEDVTPDMDAGSGVPMMSVAADAAPRTDYTSDDADTSDYRYDAAPQASEPDSAAESAASKKSAPAQRSAAESVPEQEEATDGVPLAAGSVDTESASDEDTAPDTNQNTAAAPIPEPEAELYAVSVSVWAVPAGAASLLEPYPRAGESKSGVWYALTAAEFDALSLKLADSNMEAVPGGDTPPTMWPDAEYYIFVPSPR